jgi:hypothetical protein
VIGSRVPEEKPEEARKRLAAAKRMLELVGP